MEDKTIEVLKEKKFRMANQYLLLTYKTHVDKDKMREFLGSKETLKSCDIAHETGLGDPNNPYAHSHVVVVFMKAIKTTNAAFFDYPTPEGEIHPHIQPFKKHELKIKLNYIAKEDVSLQHLKKENTPTLALQIWSAENKQEALLLAKKPGDVTGILALYANKPVQEKEDNLKLREWQGDLLQDLAEKPDDRKIIWYMDERGGCGKSRFTRWMVKQKLAYCLTNLGGSYHAASTIKSAIDNGWNQKILIVDLSRGYEDKDIYDPLEAIKNGMITSVKYAGQTVEFEPPHVVVFANFMPNLQKMSMDRWDIRVITKCDDLAYNIKKLDLKFLFRYMEHMNLDIPEVSDQVIKLMDEYEGL